MTVGNEVVQIASKYGNLGNDMNDILKEISSAGSSLKNSSSEFVQGNQVWTLKNGWKTKIKNPSNVFFCKNLHLTDETNSTDDDNLIVEIYIWYNTFNLLTLGIIEPIYWLKPT